MKIKGLFFGMFACAALAACSNEDIVEEGKVIEEVKANLTLVIGAASNSSRESSEIGESKDDGTLEESAVNSALVVLAPVKSGEAGYEFDGAQIVKNLTKSDLTQAEVAGATVYMPTFKLEAGGQYKVLVVLNPNTGLTAEVAAASDTEKYNAILDYEYSYDGTGTNEMVGAGKDPSSFVMVNQTEVIATVESNNEQDPSIQEVPVERVASKITFIPSTMEVEGQTYSNRYSVKVKTGQKEVAETREGYRMENKIGIHMTGLNKAKLLADNSEIWIQNGTAAYLATTEKYPGTDLYIYEPTTMPEKNEFDYEWKTNTSTEKYWYVQLDDYALVNLSNKVYAARHLASADFTQTKELGLLDATYRWILDPNTTAKNAETDLTNIAGDYFYNKVKDVQAAEKDYANAVSDTYADYFSALPTTAEEDDNDKKSIGTRLAYCLENVVKVANQQPQMVTGIIFRGQIYDENHIAMGTIYKCNEKYYTTLEQMYSENPGTTDYETYNSGKCYYYSSDIMHYENDDYMKKVIMRNNVYALSIKSFKEMGSAEVTIPKGTEDHDENFYLELSAQILPWQVRFNEIVFN